MKHTYTATSIAWMASDYGIRRFTEAMKAGDPAEVVDALAFSNNEDMGRGTMPWTRVGRAEITVTIESEDAVVTGAVQALKERQKSIRAEAERATNDIERQIQQLQHERARQHHPRPHDLPRGL